MVHKDYTNISIKKSLKRELDHEKKHKTFSEFIEELLLKARKGKDIISTQDADLDVPCLSRYEDQGVHVCCRRAPNTKALETLKICQACPSRLTPEKAERERTETHHYPMCGAREHQDGKTLLVYSTSPSCPKHLQNTWHTVEACLKAKCPKLKTYQVRVP